jgi:hypothetical protein
MQRPLVVVLVLVAFNVVATLGVGIFVVHGSVRDGCAQANAAAAQAWLAVALADSGERRLAVVAAADTALAHAAGEAHIAHARAIRLPWGGDEAALVAATRELAGDAPARTELALQASRKALAVCGD